MSDRIQTSYTIARSTKALVDLLSTAFEIDKIEVIDQAVKAYAIQRRAEVYNFISEVIDQVVEAYAVERPAEVDNLIKNAKRLLDRV